jgi:hypothetical protein
MDPKAAVYGWGRGFRGFLDLREKVIFYIIRYNAQGSCLPPPPPPRQVEFFWLLVRSDGHTVSVIGLCGLKCFSVVRMTGASNIVYLYCNHG